MTERQFTPAEVEALIPRLTPLVERAMTAQSEAAGRQERLRAVRQRIELTGGGIIDQAAWRDDAETLGRATAAMREALEAIQDLGGMVKDLGMGLVDFPHLRRGQTVNLCWKHGEREIHFWHGLDEGYASRKPL